MKTPPGTTTAVVPAVLMLLLVGLGCGGPQTPPDPIGDTAPPKDPSVDDPIDETPAPRPVVTLPEGVEARPAAAIAEAPDEVSRLFACLDYNHVTLLARPRENLDDVIVVLAELIGGQPVCSAAVATLLKGYRPIIASFESEWTFYTKLYALTAQVMTEHNPQTYCERLRDTVEAVKQAVSDATHYQRWLSRELRDNPKVARSNPYLGQMSVAASEKVRGLIIVATDLRNQLRTECR